MGYHAEVLLDSISPRGDRLTTMLISYPRIVHQQMTRHRSFSRSVASSRAISVARTKDKILDDPFVPEEWRTAVSGMSAGPLLDEATAEECETIWRQALQDMERHTQALVDRRLSKEVANRLLECFSFTTEIVTATDYDEFFKLRVAHDKAQGQIVRIAEMMQRARDASRPRLLAYGEWHVPMIREVEAQLPLRTRLDISAGRCARTSYDTHLEARPFSDEAELTERLVRDEHWSPLEHQATPSSAPSGLEGNLRGWAQFRKIVQAHVEDSWILDGAAEQRV